VSKHIEAQSWEIGELGGSKLFQLETLLKDMIRLHHWSII